MHAITFQLTDGGREAAGFKGKAGDCVVRAIAVASGRPYLEVYDEISAASKGRERTRKSKARDGVYTSKQWFKDYMQSQGRTWVPTMTIGSGCKVHLRSDELPRGRLIVAVSKHYTVVIDGIIHDRYDPSRDGTRCVYGYWTMVLKCSTGQSRLFPEIPQCHRPAVTHLFGDPYCQECYDELVALHAKLCTAK